MGQRLAPTSAIAFTSRTEKPVLSGVKSCTSGTYVIFYMLYRLFCTEKMNVCFKILNKQAPSIQFTGEKRNEDCLPFLNA